MKAIILLSILTFALCANDQTCPVYTCKNIDNQNRNGNTTICGQRNSPLEYVVDNDCQTNFTCELNNPEFLYNASQPRHVEFCSESTNMDIMDFKYPGDICTNTTECLGEALCMNEICEVKNPHYGANCTFSSDCAAGQYCTNGKSCEFTLLPN